MPSQRRPVGILPRIATALPCRNHPAIRHILIRAIDRLLSLDHQHRGHRARSQQIAIEQRPVLSEPRRDKLLSVPDYRAHLLARLDTIRTSRRIPPGHRTIRAAIPQPIDPHLLRLAHRLDQRVRNLNRLWHRHHQLGRICYVRRLHQLEIYLTHDRSPASRQSPSLFRSGCHPTGASIDRVCHPAHLTRSRATVRSLATHQS